MLSLNALLGPKPAMTSVKFEPFECGATPVDVINVKAVPIKYYAVAILFILFDLEIAFPTMEIVGATVGIEVHPHTSCTKIEPPKKMATRARPQREPRRSPKERLSM